MPSESRVLSLYCLSQGLQGILDAQMADRDRRRRSGAGALNGEGQAAAAVAATTTGAPDFVRLTKDQVRP